MAAFRLSERYLGEVAGHVATGRQPDDPAAGWEANHRQRQTKRRHSAKCPAKRRRCFSDDLSPPRQNPFHSATGFRQTAAPRRLRRDTRRRQFRARPACRQPFFWHIYPQDENVHLDKLHAFWDKAHGFYTPETASAHRRLSDDLNGGEALSATQRLECWQILQQHQNDWRRSAEEWSRYLFSQPSAPEKLAAFISKHKKIR